MYNFNWCVKQDQHMIHRWKIKVWWKHAMFKLN